MKSNTLIILAILVISLFLVGGLGLSVAGDSKGETVTYYSPDFVQLDCTQIRSDVSSRIGDFEYVEGDGDGTPENPQGKKFTKIACNQFTDKCETFINVKDDINELTTFCSSGIDLYKCSSGAKNCVELDIDLTGSRNVDVKLVDLNKGEELYARGYYNSGFLCGNSNKLPTDVVVITETHDTYGLVIQGDTALEKNEGSCKISDSVQSRLIKNIDGKATGEIGVYSQPITSLRFDEIGDGISYLSYVNEWNPISTSSVYKYGNKDVYCSGVGRLYEFGEIETVKGEFRNLAPTKFLKEVECCPYINGCTLDFKWDLDAPSNCISDLQCRQGVFYSDGSKKISQESCVEGSCVVTDVKTVECSLDSDCGASEWCNKQTWKCQAGTLPDQFCGDGVCNLNEDNDTCPKDCNYKEQSTNVLLYSILVGVLVILFMIVIKQGLNSKKRRRK